MGSPYSNHGLTFPVLEWNLTGLGINPSIVGGAYDGFTHGFGYTMSDMDLKLQTYGHDRKYSYTYNLSSVSFLFSDRWSIYSTS
jgi:hypothetical protein